MRILLPLTASIVLITTALVNAARIDPAHKTSMAALQHLSWLVGTWESNLGGDIAYESWRSETPLKFRGLGFAVNGNDTVISEKLLIEAADSGLFYISDVAHNPAPVYFKMTRQDSLTTVFENPTHDFPTRIIYRQISQDSLHARIEGVRKGKQAGVDFLFKRIK